MSIYTYRPKDVRFLVDGIPVTGLSQDSFISVEYDDDKVTKTIDANGGGVFNVSSSTAGAITVTFLQSSPWLGVLTNAAIAGKTLAIVLDDANEYPNKIKFACDRSMIRQVPAYEFGAEAGEVDVIFDCIQLRALSLPVSI